MAEQNMPPSLQQTCPRALTSNNPNLLNAYAAYKKLKHKNGTSHKLKGKENLKIKQQIHSQ